MSNSQLSQEQLQSQPFGESESSFNPNFSNNTELQTRENIPFTPFFVVGQPDKGYFAAMGNNIITDYMKTKEDVINYVNAQPYEFLITLMHLICKFFHDMKNGETPKNS